jgi:hypothetical protein
MGESKPTMFIGSSVEGKRIAETIQLALEYDVHSTVWHQGVFGLSSGTLESLVAAIDDYDFATLVLTPDDLLEKRDVTGRCPRDNVLFELGLFMGALGRNRTFIVHSRSAPLLLPSDLAGIAPATFEERNNLAAALGPACTKIRLAIESQKLRSRSEQPASPDPDIAGVGKLLSAQNTMLTELCQRLLGDHRNAAPSREGSGELDFLAGAWRASPDDSHAYCVVHSGVPQFVYCYGGNDEATGEYYDFRKIGDELVGQFRWFKASLRGFARFKIESPTQLTGDWWISWNAPGIDIDHVASLQAERGANTSVWTKYDVPVFPRWATAALRRPR